MSFKILSRLARRALSVLRAGAAPALLLALVACGGGAGSSGTIMPSGCSAASCGTAMLTLTDATGDFTSYTVDVTSLKLTRADGAVVETLPATTRVDFTQLVNVTELVTATTIPQGEYVSAAMTVDYTNAAVFVEVNGAPVQASVVDSGGNAVTTLTLNVKLDNAHHFIVSPGQAARLALDFNLAASNTVDTTKTPPVVTVQPFIVASVVPSDNKDVRVRGALVSVDATAATYTVDLRPFDNDAGGDDQVVVSTTAQTTFEVNGVSSTGAAGITALAGLTPGSWTVAFGTLSSTDHSFTASRVLAGSSVQMPSLDGLIGIVTARTGNTLSVRGATLHSHMDNDDRFSPKPVTLTIGTGTTFTVAGQPSAMPTVAWPSVGSAITAFGTAGTDASGNPTFDATGGRVRLEITSLWGFVVATGTGQVTLNVQSIGGLAPTEFSYAGTGTTTAQDSNPAMYVVTTGTLPLPPVSATSPIRYFGIVQPFGSAPPDFNANTQVDFADAFAKLEVDFGLGSAAAFSTVSATDLVLNLADPLLGHEHVIQAGPLVIDLTTLPASPMIVPDATGPNMFAISDGTSEMLSMYLSYADFEAALATKLTGTTTVKRVLALGHWDQASNTFTARQIDVILGGG